MSVTKERSPIKIMLVVIIILLIGIAVVQLFVKQTTTDGQKIGYFGMKPDEPETPVVPATTPITTL